MMDNKNERTGLYIMIAWILVVSVFVFFDGPYGKKLNEIKAMKPCSTETQK